MDIETERDMRWIEWKRLPINIENLIEKREAQISERERKGNGRDTSWEAGQAGRQVHREDGKRWKREERRMKRRNVWNEKKNGKT